jgi:hypothetical protein
LLIIIVSKKQNVNTSSHLKILTLPKKTKFEIR